MNVKAAIKRNITVPNLLSCLRLAVIPPTVRYIVKENYVMAGIMLLISAVSDMFDGMIARRFNQVTQLGKMLDPLADKLTLAAVILSLSFVDKAVMWFVAVLITKELLMLAGGFLLLRLNMKPPAARWYGKTATVIFYTSVTVIVSLRAVWGIRSYVLTAVLLSVTTAAMLFALIMYGRIFISMLKQHFAGKK